MLSSLTFRSQSVDSAYLKAASTIFGRHWRFCRALRRRVYFHDHYGAVAIEDDFVRLTYATHKRKAQDIANRSSENSLTSREKSLRMLNRVLSKYEY